MKKTKEVRFELLNGHYLRILDPWNWIIAKMVRRVEKKTGKLSEPAEEVVGYYPTLIMAFDGCVDKCLFEAKSNKELAQIIKDLKELKFNIKK